MNPNVLRTSSGGDQAILVCWHYKMPSVVGYQIPGVLTVVIPLAILLGACGLLFVVRPNLRGRMVVFGPASVAALGVVAICALLYTLDCPDIGGMLALIVAVCSIPIPFATDRKIQLT